MSDLVENPEDRFLASQLKCDFTAHLQTSTSGPSPGPGLLSASKSLVLKYANVQFV